MYPSPVSCPGEPSCPPVPLMNPEHPLSPQGPKGGGWWLLEGMFLANMGRGRNTGRRVSQGPGRAGSRGHTCSLHVGVLKGEGAVHDGGLWGRPNSLQAAAGRATVSKRPREPAFLGLLCSLPGPPFKAQFCGVVPLYARGSSVCHLFKSIYFSLTPREGRGRGSWKGSQSGWEGTEQGAQWALPGPLGCQLPMSRLQPRQGREGEVLTRELTHGSI